MIFLIFLKKKLNYLRGSEGSEITGRDDSSVQNGEESLSDLARLREYFSRSYQDSPGIIYRHVIRKKIYLDAAIGERSAAMGRDDGSVDNGEENLSAVT